MSKYAGNIVTTGADTGYSVVFDGTGDYLTIPDNAAFNLSTNDWTIESWFYATAYSTNYPRLWGQSTAGASGNNSVGLFFQTQGDGSTINLRWGTTTNQTNDSNAITINATVNLWHHIAVVRDGSTMRLYFNGVQKYSTSVAGVTFYDSSAVFAVGANSGGTETWQGYISNLRLVNGTCLYTGGTTFVPPTQLLRVTNTQLLTCNSPAIVDQSSNNFAITANGNAAVSTFSPFAGYQAYNPALGAATPGVWKLSDALNAAATRQWNMYDPYFKNTTLLLHGTTPNNVPTWITDASTNNFAVTPVGDARAAGLSPFSLTTYPNSGSGYFDGSGDYLTVPYTATNFGTGDFTVETWIYYSSRADYNVVLDTRASATANPFVFGLTQTNGYVYYYNGTEYASTSAAALNTWNHIAVSRSGTTIKLFLNGVEALSRTDSSNLTGTSTGTVVIGRSIGGTGQIAGYLSNLRVVKGSAVYTGAFTVPTAPLTAVTNTSLLTLQNSQSSNNNAFLDSSSNNFLLTRNGNTTQGSFTPFSPSGWSCYLPSGSTLGLPSSTAFGMGTGDFTIAFWLRPDGTQQSSSSPLDMRVSGGGGTQNKPTFFNTPSSGTTLNMSYYTAGATKVGGFIEANQWAHVAYSRVSGTGRLFINGNLVGAPVSDTTDYGTSNDVVMGVVGDNRGFSTGFWQGNLSNVQIIKGTGFTSFPLPTAPATAINNTSALILQNNRLVDNSANNFTVSTGGTPSIQAFSPFNSLVTTPVTNSVWFNGSTDYFTTPQVASLNIGTGAFTCEAWVYPTAGLSGGGHAIMNLGDGAVGPSGPYTGWGLILQYSSATTYNVGWYRYDGTETNLVTSNTLGLNQWYHILAVRSGTTLSIYINGVRGYTSSSNSISYSNVNTNPLYVGKRTDGGAGSPHYFQGAISNARLLVGTAAYDPTQATVTVPTSPFATNTTNQQLLVCQATSLIDSNTATTAKVLTSFGTTKPVSSPNPFGFGVDQSSINASYTTAVQGGSGYYDGTGDYLQVANNTALNLGGTSWTLECWCYPTGGAGTYRGLLAKRQALSGEWDLGFSNTDYIYFWNGTGYTGTLKPTLNAWNHMVATHDGTNLRLFLNGVLAYGPTAVTITNTTDAVGIGGNPNGVGENFTGYISGARVIKGTAVYTSAFTPPTAPPTPITNTSLLLNFTNAGIVDSTGKNVLETVGNAQISTTQSKYGGSSMYFGSTNGNYLTTYDPTYKDSVGGGDWTFECWVYVNALPASASVPVAFYHLKNDAALATTVFVIEIVNTGAVNLSTGAALISAGTAGKITTGSWIHFACARSSGTFKTYFNGVSDISVANTTTYNGTYVQLGAWRYSTYDFSLNGYLQDVRISKYARYTSNFTPPTSLLQNQ